MLLASFNTIPLVNLKPELWTAAIGHRGINQLSRKLGPVAFSLRCGLYSVNGKQQGQPVSFTELCPAPLLLRHIG